MAVRELRTGQSVVEDVPRCQIPPVSVAAGELVELTLFAFGDTPVVSPQDIPGVTWIEVVYGSVSNDCAGVWIGIATQDVTEARIQVNHATAHRVGWIVRARTEYRGGNGGLDSYLQATFARAQTTRTLGPLSFAESLVVAAFGTVGPDTLTVVGVPPHTERSRVPGESGGGIEAVLIEGTETSVEFSVANSWFAGAMVSFEFVEGPDGNVQPPPDAGPGNDGIGTRRSHAVWFITGHSLTDEPLNQYVRLLARSMGLGSDYSRQYEIGSHILWRTGGDDPYPYSAWEGYSFGHNRSGSGLNLIPHFRNVQPVGGKETDSPYTHLIVAEGHDILITLADFNTVPLLRHYYELVREGSSGCLGYFYSTWLDYNISDVPGWVEYARETDTAHVAMVSRINASLAYEGRSDRLMLLPAAGALAELVDRATTGIVAGVTQGTLQDTMSMVFSDQVHLTNVGFYFLACVVYGSVYRRDPRGLPYPVQVTETQADSVQEIAWDVLLSTYGTDVLGPQMSPEDAKQAIIDYIPIFDAAYPFGSYDDVTAMALFSGTSSHMHFDPPSSENIWLAAPTGGNPPAVRANAAILSMAF